jgi:sortase (surface protein transpeptidase)
VNQRWLPLVLAVLVAASTLAAATAGCAARPQPDTPAAVTVPGPSRASPTSSAALDATAGSAPPTRLRIPAIGVDAPLEPLGLDASGMLDAPKDFRDAGWYADGTLPGEVGPAVIAGHVDSKDGPAVFFRLGQLHASDLVEVARAGTWVRFRVVAVDRYPKDRFPTDRVYGPTPDPQLRLITCSGRFDPGRGTYLDNTVVYAVST